MSYPYTVVIYIPKTCNSLSVEITHDTADVINRLVYVEKGEGRAKRVQACTIVEKDYMIWRDDGILKITMKCANRVAMDIAIDEVMRLFQTSRWQHSERKVDRFDKKNLRRIKGQIKFYVYRAAERTDHLESS